MQRIKKALKRYFSRGAAFALALMLVALPCLSLPVFAAETSDFVVDYGFTVDGESYVVGHTLPALDVNLGMSAGTFFCSIVSSSEYFVDKYISYKVVVPLALVSLMDFSAVADLVSFFSSYVQDYSAVYGGNSVNSLNTLGFSAVLDHYDETADVVEIYYNISFSHVDGYAAYIFNLPAFGSVSFDLLQAAPPPLPTLAGSVGESITGVLGWVGTVINSIVTPGGALYTLLPLFVIGISIAFIFVAYKIIRAYVWGM